MQKKLQNNFFVRLWLVAGGEGRHAVSYLDFCRCSGCGENLSVAAQKVFIFG